MSVRGEKGLDPVTFEVLRNAFVSIVDQMADDKFFLLFQG